MKKIYIKFKWILPFVLVAVIAMLILLLPKKKREDVTKVTNRYLAEKRGEAIDIAIDQRIKEIKEKEAEVADAKEQIKEIEAKRDEKVKMVEESDLRGLSNVMRDLGY